MPRLCALEHFAGIGEDLKNVSHRHIPILYLDIGNYCHQQGRQFGVQGLFGQDDKLTIKK
jgi:hypothetical protein